MLAIHFSLITTNQILTSTTVTAVNNGDGASHAQYMAWLLLA